MVVPSVGSDPMYTTGPATCEAPLVVTATGPEAPDDSVWGLVADDTENTGVEASAFPAIALLVERGYG